jgi:nitroreductase
MPNLSSAVEESCGRSRTRVRLFPCENRDSLSGFTTEGEKVVVWAQGLSEAISTLKHVFAVSNSRKAIAPLLDRRSVSPKRLEAPGADSQEIDLMIEAALRAPDHGGLHPWRVLVFPADSRARLADLFEQEKLRRDPLASSEDLRRAREHATRSPTLLAFIISPKLRMRVPEREQWLAAGSALGNLLNAAHQLGFGAIMLSGERCFDVLLCSELGSSPPSIWPDSSASAASGQRRRSESPSCSIL